MKNPSLALHRHYHALRQEIDKIGIRETARRCRATPMRIHRFRQGNGARDAATLYIVAAAVGYQINLTPVRHRRTTHSDRLHRAHRRYTRPRTAPVKSSINELKPTPRSTPRFLDLPKA